MIDIKTPIGAQPGHGQLPQQTTYTRYLFVKSTFAGLPFNFSDLVKVDITRTENEAIPEDYEFKELYLQKNKSLLPRVLYIIDGVREINDSPIKDEQNPLEK